MRIQVEVDISGVIGQTHVDTVFALSNRKSRAIALPAAVKRAALRHLRGQKPPAKRPYLRIYAAGLFLLLEPLLSQLELITLDVEYTGLEASIKGMLLRHIRRVRGDFPKEAIAFKRIGKKARAHLLALQTFRGQLPPDKRITEAELLALL